MDFQKKMVSDDCPFFTFAYDYLFRLSEGKPGIF